jgi:glycosyltransferase involved in cell wall biosynthesis
MRPRTALVIPTFNEVEAIGAVVAEVPRAAVDRIIVADGGSTDGTCECAALAGAEVVHAGRGYGRACLAGAAAAADADILVFMDGDGADDPAAIEALIHPIAAGSVDFAIGSRLRGRAAAGSMGWHQRCAGLGLGWAMGILYGVRYTDLCALRAIRRELLFGLGMREMTYGWNLEMQMRVARAGRRVLELPVDNRARLGGQSKVAGSFSGSLRAGTRIAATFGRLLFAPQGIQGDA